MSFSKRRLKEYVDDVMYLAERYIFSRDPKRVTFALGKFETAICVGAQLRVFMYYPRLFSYDMDDIRGCHIVGPWCIKDVLDEWRSQWFSKDIYEDEYKRCGTRFIDRFRYAFAQKLYANMTAAARKTLGVDDEPVEEES